VEAMYWNDKRGVNGCAGSVEEMVRPMEDEILLKGKNECSGIIIMEERPFDDVVVRDTHDTEYANVSYV